MPHLRDLLTPSMTGSGRDRVRISTRNRAPTMLPNFLVIGAMKSGTSSFAHYLGMHPEVFMSENKEPAFFSRPERFALGLSWYGSLFEDAGAAVARGEASTGYTKYPAFSGTPERIAAAIPDVRLMYLVRHPIERIRSQYLHQVLRGQEKRTLVQIFADNGDHYLDLSRYSLQLDQYLEFFDREQLLVLTSDQLRTDRVETMNRAYEFIGVHPGLGSTFDEERHVTTSLVIPKPIEQQLQRLPGRRLVSRVAPTPVRSLYRRFSSRSVHSGLRAAAHLPPELVRRLEDQLAGEVVRLRGFLGQEFDGWGIA
jgi:hypothetical protein